MTHSNILERSKQFFQNDIAAMCLAVAMMILLAGAPLTGFAAEKTAVTKKPQAEHVAAKVNINKADAATLANTLTGVGLKKAEAIIAWRAKFGKFVRVEQLMEVKGIGEKTLAKNRSRIVL